MMVRSAAVGFSGARAAQVLAGVAASALAAWLSACGGNEAVKPQAPSEPTQSDSESAAALLVHEKCEASGNRVEAMDANNDGKPDISRIFDAKSGVEVCRSSDLTHDGKSEMFEYFDPAGVLRRRELGFDSTGAIGSVELFEQGKLVKRLLDSTGQRRVDTWDTFDPATGKRTTRERDTSHDGKVDQWWTYNADGSTTIASDHNNDGQPDTDGVLTVNAAGSLVGPDAGIAAAPATDAGSNSVASRPVAPPVAMPEPLAPAADAGADAGRKKPAAGGATAKANK